MSISSVGSVAPTAARPVQKNDGDGDDVKAAAPKAVAKTPDGDSDDALISGATKVSSIASPALQSVISSLPTRG